MGTVYAEITLKNAFDEGLFSHGYIKKQEIREATMTAVVDTGAATLIINEDVQKKLGLKIEGEQISTLANGETINCKVSEAVKICWKDRYMTCQPWVLDGAEEILLGAIPLENMDLIVDPKNEKVVGRHGDEQICMIR
jgi:clan AA aspartic protease